MDTLRTFLPRTLIGAGIALVVIMALLGALSLGNPIQAAAFIAGGLCLGGTTMAVGMMLDSAMNRERLATSTNAYVASFTNMLAEYLAASRQGA